MPDYLSTDPTEGITGPYLSTDPTAGDAQAPVATTGGRTGGGPGPLSVVAADAARRGIERTAMQVATSPNVGRVTRAISGPAVARGVTSAVGAVVGGVPGAVVGAAIPTKGMARTGAHVAETSIRGSAGFLARLAGSPLARTVTGLPGLIGSMVFEPGDRPAGETAETTAARQTDFAHQFKEQVNREAGYEVITGSTTPEILDSIARYRGAQ